MSTVNYCLVQVDRQTAYGGLMLLSGNKSMTLLHYEQAKLSTEIYSTRGFNIDRTMVWGAANYYGFAESGLCQCNYVEWKQEHDIKTFMNEPN